jgi:hypothetical protein
VKTPGKTSQFLDKHREQMDQPEKYLEYWNLQNNTLKSNKGSKDKRKRQIY